jgi:dihydropteroate synthase
VTLRPAFRLVPPETLRWSADAEAPWLVEFGTDIETVVRATAALGLGCVAEGGRARVLGPRSALAALRDELALRGATAAAGALGRSLAPVRRWRMRGRELSLERPLVMGIVNATDDSFSGDGVGRDPERAIARGLALAEAGADIVDVGGESARADRPQANPREEAAIVARVTEGLAARGIAVSVDTYKPDVARAALEAGAVVVNDISGLTVGTGAAEAAKAAGAGYVLNFSYEQPKRRPHPPPRYVDVVLETLAWFEARLERLWALGLEPEFVAIDPGIAFGKSHDEDLQVLRRLGEFTSFGLPLLLAHSRKNFIGSATGQPPHERDLETHIVTAFAFVQGARIFRVHDVAGTRRALAMAEALAARGPGAFAPDEESWPWAAGARAPHAAGPGAALPPPPGQRW